MMRRLLTKYYSRGLRARLEKYQTEDPHTTTRDDAPRMILVMPRDWCQRIRWTGNLFGTIADVPFFEIFSRRRLVICASSVLYQSSEEHLTQQHIKHQAASSTKK
jgi:hypothetical protein